jgi:hypothetical protein
VKVTSPSKMTKPVSLFEVSFQSTRIWEGLSAVASGVPGWLGGLPTTEVAVGVAVGSGGTWSAPSSWMRLRTRPLRGSVMGTPLLRKTMVFCETLLLGKRWRSKAHAPATCGAAIDVPERKS